MSSPSIYDRIYAVVTRIPYGRVVTYGQIASHLGMPHGARTVGWAMRHCPEGLPWHRVVNAAGKTSQRASDGQQFQRRLLEDEGIEFGLNSRIDLDAFGWKEIEVEAGHIIDRSSLQTQGAAAMASNQEPNPYRAIPGVDVLLQDQRLIDLREVVGQDALVAALRVAQGWARAEIQNGSPALSSDALVERVIMHLQPLLCPSLAPVINATGIVLHTNLGRAPLSAAVQEAMQNVSHAYSNLEFDLDEGHRGSRYLHAEELLCHLSGAEAALLVNNNAGAVLLTLAALAQGREVIISRSQLVEIGGGFRIPEVMTQSGARLVEVGTSNRTYIHDYARAISEQTAALMRVHTSNYRISGFVHQPTLSELVTLGEEHGLPVLDDLGSGTLLDTAQLGLAHEPTVQESVAAGADVVTFSGDKLLGGPQAGIIVGRADLIATLRHWPLTRALRVDKTTIAGIQANLGHYVRGEALREVPVWRMMAMGADEIGARAQRLQDQLGARASGCELLTGESKVGGGSLPEQTLPTTLLALPEGNAAARARDLRLGTPHVVARIVAERVLLDLRTVLPEQEPALLVRLREVI